METSFTAEEVKVLNNFGFTYYPASKEYFCDSGDCEEAVTRDAFDSAVILRQRIWNNDAQEYKDEYTHFSTFAELVSFL
jgi:hypothetical protein